MGNLYIFIFRFGLYFAINLFVCSLNLLFPKLGFSNQVVGVKCVCRMKRNLIDQMGKLFVLAETFDFFCSDFGH
jgi:hypothetical protein